VSRLAATELALAKCYNGAVHAATEKAPVVSLRLVPKLPRAADRSLLSWQGRPTHNSAIYSGALPCWTSNIIVHIVLDATRHW